MTVRSLVLTVYYNSMMSFKMVVGSVVVVPKLDFEIYIIYCLNKKLYK